MSLLLALRPVGQATETEAARSITVQKRVAVGQAIATNTAQPIAGFKDFAAKLLSLHPGLYWRLDESSGNALDSSGHNRQGTPGGSSLSRAVTGLLTGDSDTAASSSSSGNLSGTASRFDSTYAIFASGAAFTVLVLETHPGSYGDFGQPLWGGDTNIGATYLRVFDDTHIRFTPDRDSANPAAEWTVPSLGTGKHLIGFTFDESSNVAELYLDGVSQGTKTVTVNFSSTRSFSLGWDSIGDSWVGTWDEVAVVPGIVSASDMAALWTLAATTRVDAGEATEADSAQSVTPRHQKAVGQTTEADTAQTLAHTKDHAAGEATETDAAQSVTAQRRESLGQATETDAARSVSSRKSTAVGEATETDTAQTAGAQRREPVGQSVETDTAEPLTHVKQTPVGESTETDAAQTVTAQRRESVGQAQESDAAQSLGDEHAEGTGQAVETDTAQGVTAQRRYALGEATETDAAESPSSQKLAGVDQAIETDEAQTIGLPGVFGQATESDAAQPVGSRKEQGVGQASEADTADTVASRKSKTLAVAPTGPTQFGGDNQAQSFQIRKLQDAGQATEADSAFHVSTGGAINVDVGLATESDEAPHITVQKPVEPTGPLPFRQPGPMPTGAPAPLPRGARRRVRVEISVGASDRATVAAVAPGASALGVPTLGSRRVRSFSVSTLETEVAGGMSHAVRGVERIKVRTRGDRKASGTGPETEAALLALDIL